MEPAAPKGNFYYGWVIVLIGFFTVFTSLGLARFAYGMLIPSMRQGLGLSYDSAGFISSSNFAGYLASVALAPYIIKKLKPRLAISLGLLIIAVCMIMISSAHSPGTIAFLYALTGAGSGLANIIIMVLISHWFLRSKRGKAAGLMVTGNGVAIISAGYFVPFINSIYGSEGWRSAWFVMGIITLAVSLSAVIFLRNSPEDMGLMPIGHGAPEQKNPDKKAGTAKLLLALGLLYFIFGATYVIYGTFIVSSIINDYGLSESTAGMFWSFVGFFGLFSGIGFGMFSDRAGRKKGLAVVFAVQTAAYLLAGSQVSNITLGLSVFFYGIAAFSIPTIMAAAVGDYFGTAKAAVSFSIITFFFAAGQTGGPSLAGILAEHSGSFSGSYLLSGALTACGVAVALFLPPPNA
ncbi:MAG: MFS transporter [Deferribacterales bacterium]